MHDEAGSTAFTEQNDSDLFSGLPSRYEYKRVLGKGGMSTVFLAHDHVMGRDVSLKLLQLNEKQDHQTVERFKREAKILGSFDHSNIVKLLSFGSAENGDQYLALEFIDGKTLSEEIAGGKQLSLARFRDIFCQLCSGLDYAHSKGIIHRDLKPSNIIISTEENKICAKLIDFGIARIESPDGSNGRTLTRTGALLGSPLYMSPEQCKGLKGDQLSDIYSLACIMYESLTGRPPHQAESAMDLLYKHISVAAESLERKARNSQSKALGALIDRCLSKDPSQRPASAAIVNKSLQEIFASPVHDEFFAGDSKKKNSKAKIAITAIVLTIAAIATCWHLLGSQNKNKSSYVDFDTQQKIRLSHEKARRLQEVTKQLNEAKKTYSEAKNKEERQDSISFVMTAWEDLSDYHRKYEKDFVKAEDDLQKAREYCKQLPPRTKEIGQLTLLRDIAECRMLRHDLKGTQESIDEAAKIDVFFPPRRAEFMIVQINLDATREDFAKARQLFTSAIEPLKACDELHKVTSYDLKNSENGAKLADRFSADQSGKIVSTIKRLLSAGIKDKAGALELNNDVLELLISEDDRRVKGAAELSKTLLSKISPDTPSYAKLKDRTDKLLAEVAD